MIFQPGANNLAFVVEIFRADEAHDAVNQEWVEHSRHSISSRFQGYLVHAVVGFSREGTALPCFEIHHVRAFPFDVATAMMFEHALAAFSQRRERNAEAAIRRLSACNRLKEQVHRCSALHGRKLSADVRKAASLRRHLIGFHQSIEGAQDCADRLDGIRGGIHTDYRVAASVEQTLERRKQNSSNVIDGMIWLRAYAKHSAFAHGIPAACDIPNFCRGEYEVFVAHYLG